MADVMRHLEDVLSSPAFRTSHRSCQFLRFIVHAAAAGHADLLKERTVGEKVFGRPLDYDTGQDSIVRVKAGEVRRRLAQYYDLHPESPVRIELPAGTYAPVFHRAAPEATGLATPVRASRTRRRGALWLAGALALTLPVVIVCAWRAGHASLFSEFWQPFFDVPGNPIVSVPTPETYRIYGRGKAALLDALRPRAPGEPVPPLPVDQAANVKIVSEPGDFLGIGDARSLMLLYAFLERRGKNPQIRFGNETSFTELREGADLLIGGFTNRWTVDLLKEARFAFESEGSVYGIRDRSSGKFVCRKPPAWEPRGAEDCALVTRMVRAKTGNPLLVAAGLDHFGTFEAGEFLTRPDLLGPALRSLRPGWEHRNVQLVFRVEVVRDNVGPPQVVATHVW